MDTLRRVFAVFAFACCLSACAAGAGSPTILPTAAASPTVAPAPTPSATATPTLASTATTTPSATPVPAPTATATATRTPFPTATSTATSAPSLCPDGCREPPPECAIKGNISVGGEKIYHMPGQRFYADTVINPERGERWFCTEAEARANGWRKSLQ